MISIACRQCGTEVAINTTHEAIAKWKSGTLIQDAMPEVPPAHREMFITKICGVCFEKLFGEEE